MIVGVDSMILIYAGIVPRKGANQSEQLEKLSMRAKILLHDLREATIVLPTVAIAELLVPVQSHHSGAVTATLEERFHCRPFDLHAASIAASLWRAHKTLPEPVQYTERHVLKSDVMIIATAKAAQATEFYSHDAKCRALAKVVMTARDLPTHSEDLFLERDIREGEV